MSLRDIAKPCLLLIAPPGGQLPAAWHATILEALNAGLDIASGLHQRLSRIPELAGCAARTGRKIHDVRNSDGPFNVGTGMRRAGRRLLTVGTDCALGKKYTPLAISKAMAARGGVAVDAVVADFVAGVAEALSPANAPDHWDIIEGQGSMFHPAYSGVTLGLLHSSQPDALVLCHDPTRKSLHAFPHVPVVSLEQAISAYLAAAHLTNPAARFVGVALNTSALSDSEAAAVIARTAESLRLPCVDPIRTGVTPIVSALEAFDLRS